MTGDQPPRHDVILEINAAKVSTLLLEVESLKNRGNVEFHKGKALAKHTAGKNILSEACLRYAEGIQALAKADTHLTELKQQQQELHTIGSSTDSSRRLNTDCPESDALLVVDGKEEVSELSSGADNLRSALYLNLAAVNLLLEEWAPALACCTHVIDGLCRDSIADAEAALPAPVGAAESRRDRKNGDRQLLDVAAKALYRRSTARVGMGGDQEVLAARDDLRLALKLKPGDGNVRRELKKVDKMVADAQVRENLRRETEEGRRRRQQQHGSPGGNAVNSAGGSSSPNDKHDDNRIATKAVSSATAISAATADGANREPEGDSKSGEGGDMTPSQPPRPPQPTGNTSNHHPETVVHRNNDCQALLSTTQLEAPGREGTGAGIDSEHISREGEGNGGEPDVIEERHGGRREETSDSMVRSVEDEEPFPTGNGGVCRDGVYAWNQSVREVQVCMRVPDWAQARDMRVEIRRLRLSVRAVRPDMLPKNGIAVDSTAAKKLGEGVPSIGGNLDSCHDDNSDTREDQLEDKASSSFSAEVIPAPTVTILEGVLSRPVDVDECLWTMGDTPGRVLLYLQKELATEGEPGFEWWASVMEGDAEVDVSKCDAGPLASEYPEHARRRGAKAMWEDQRKSPEQRRRDEVNRMRMLEAKKQMEEEAEERQRDLDRALQDPRKAEVYRQLQSVMPDTTISIK